MGIWLLNTRFMEFDWDDDLWVKLLALARLHGWKPQGTKMLKSYGRFTKDDRFLWGKPVEKWDPKWRGGYLAEEDSTGDRQIVATRDAAALADALARSLRQIPDERQPEKSREKDLHACFSGPLLKNNLRMFIIYCRKGRFQLIEVG